MYYFYSCGVLLNLSPLVKLQKKGKVSDKEKKQVISSIFKKAKYGTWKRDFFVAGPEKSGRFCDINEIKYQFSNFNI